MVGVIVILAVYRIFGGIFGAVAWGQKAPSPKLGIADPRAHAERTARPLTSEAAIGRAEGAIVDIADAVAAGACALVCNRRIRCKRPVLVVVLVAITTTHSVWQVEPEAIWIIEVDWLGLANTWHATTVGKVGAVVAGATIAIIVAGWARERFIRGWCCNCLLNPCAHLTKQRRIECFAETRFAGLASSNAKHAIHGVGAWAVDGATAIAEADRALWIGRRLRPNAILRIVVEAPRANRGAIVDWAKARG